MEKRIARKQSEFTDKVKIIFEDSVSWNGYSFLVIYGKHVNGGFIAIPNWKICCEASSFQDDSFYNKEQLIQAGMKEDMAEAVAVYIDNRYSQIEEGKNKQSVQQSKMEGRGR